MKKEPRGAAVTTHGLKEYGHGVSMNAGLERLRRESRQEGQIEGFKKGVEYVMKSMSPVERLFGRKFR